MDGNFIGTWRRDGLWLRMTLAALIVAFGDWLFWQQQAFGSGIGAFALAVALAALIARPAIFAGWTGRIAWVFAMLFAGALVYEPSIIGWLAFGVSLGVAILAPRVHGFGDGWVWFQRIVWQTMTAPFLPLLDLAKLLRVRRWHRQRGRARSRFSVRHAAKTLFLPLSGGLVFLFLFAAANPVLDAWLQGLGFIDLGEWLNPFRWFVAGIWFLTAWNAMRPRNATRTMPGFDGTGDLAIPGVSVASVTLSLILFNAMFAGQNAMDIAWLWGFATPPAAMNLAEYAHRGAYPLIVTALLAGLFVLVTLRPGSTTAARPAIRALVTLWVIQNIVLVASSMLRTWDYVEAYSLTILRIAALEWMALVALGLVLILWRLWAGKSGRWLVNANMGAAALVLGAAAIVDHGAIAARWNVAHAREIDGSGAGLDLAYLNALGGAALLPLIELEGRDGLAPAFRERVSSVRRQVQARVEQSVSGNGWTIRDRRRLAAARVMLANRHPVAIGRGPRNPDGSFYRPPPVVIPQAAPAAKPEVADPSAAMTSPDTRSPSAPATATPLTGRPGK
jgi:Domain of unknown function (DUF4173)